MTSAVLVIQRWLGQLAALLVGPQAEFRQWFPRFTLPVITGIDGQLQRHRHQNDPVAIQSSNLGKHGATHVHALTASTRALNMASYVFLRHRQPAKSWIVFDAVARVGAGVNETCHISCAHIAFQSEAFFLKVIRIAAR